MTETMQAALVVVRPFGRYAKGDLITDAAAIAAVAAGGNSASVVRAQVPVPGKPVSGAEH